MDLEYQSGFGNEFADRLAKTAIPIFVVILSVLVQVHSQSPASKPVDDEEYHVYDAVIAKMFAGGKVTFDNQAKVSRLVIRDRTNTDYAYGGNKENWEQVKIRLRTLSDETVADYEAKRLTSRELKLSFRIDLPYTFFAQKEYESIFGTTKNQNGTTEYWTKFYSKFPESGGYIWLSNVGFNKSGDQALVYFVHWCETACGSGLYILLKKKEKVWNVGGVGGIWMS